MRKIITKEQELEICNFYLSSPNLYDGAILYLTRKNDKCEDILRHYNL